MTSSPDEPTLEDGRRSSPATASAAAASDPIFAVEHLSLAHPGVRGHDAVSILKDVSVDVERGGALTLVGPSGSGKSTLLRCLNRLVEPTAGAVRFDGRDIRSLDPRGLRRRAVLVMQTPVLFEGTVRDNLRVRPAAAAGDFSDGWLVATLAEVGLEAGFLYQLVVVFMLGAGTAAASLLFVRLAAARYLTSAHQLRRYLV